MANDEELLHPLIREALPKARQRIKHYREKGLAVLANGAFSLAALAEQQGKDLLMWQQKRANQQTLQRIRKNSELAKGAAL